MNTWENTMNLRKVTHIYKCDDMFLYEIIEDYKAAQSTEEKNEIFSSFCSSVWSCDNKRRTYKKTIHFNVNKDLLDTEPGQIFNTWSCIEYKYYISSTRDKNWRPIIRQNINNIYTRYFDKDVILGKEYMDLIKTPKRLYYEWISGVNMNAASVAGIIENSISQSEKVKLKLQKEKLTLSWNEYKKVVEEFLRRAFENSKLIEEYEDNKNIFTRLDFLTEDHFYVKYINRSLNGEIKKWEKRSCGLPQNSRKGYKHCKLCGIIIERSGNKKMYCDKCALTKERERKRKNAYKYRIAK